MVREALGITPTVSLLMLPFTSLLTLWALFSYVASIYRFWKIDERPTDKPFVFMTRAALLSVISTILIVSANVSHLQELLFPPSIVLLTSAAYDVIIFSKIRALKRRRQHAASSTLQPTHELTTGALLTDEQINERGFYENGGFFLGALNSKPIFHPNAIHAITFGEPGSGKGTSTVVPNLMQWTGSAFVIDPKGELAAMTAQYRRTILGHNIVFLNPWNLHGLPNTEFNPLELLLPPSSPRQYDRSTTNARSNRWERTTDPLSSLSSATVSPARERREIADADALSNLIYPEPPGVTGGDNKWIRDSARKLIRTLLLYLTAVHPQMCDLVTLRRVAGLPDDEFEAVLIDMQLSEAFNGELRRDADELINKFINTRPQFEYARDDALRALSIYDNYGSLGSSVQTSTRLLDTLTRSRTTIYMMIPTEYKQSHNSWLALTVMNVLETIGRSGDARRPVLCMLDEFANLGKIPNIRNALAEYRAKGLRGWLIVQNRRQLDAVYGVDDARAIEYLCSVEQYLSVKFEHARELSDRIGQRSIRVTNYSTRTEFDDGIPEVSNSYTDHLVPVLSAQRISELRDHQLIFIDGFAMLIEKCPYWRLHPWRSHVQLNPLEPRTPSVAQSEIINVE